MWTRLFHSHRTPKASYGRRSFRPSLEALEERALLSFLPAVNYPVGTGPQVTTSASFRGNGILDVAVPNASDGTVSVLLGNGDGTFQDEKDYSTGGSFPVCPVAGEFRTGSGIQDLVVTNLASNTLAILSGNGDGTFQSPVTISGFSGPAFATKGDFNGDGNLDLAVANQNSNTLSVLLGNGDDSFQSPVNYTVFDRPRYVVAADLRGIGVQDLVVSPFPDSSHHTDIMVLLGNGDGTFQAPVSYTVGDPSNIAVGSFRTGSGILDLAVVNRNLNTVSVLLGNGDGTYQAPTNYSIGNSGQFPAIDVGDFNQDGNLDLVATNQGGSTVSVLLGNGDGSFQPATQYDVGSAPGAVTAADFNGDGYPDLAVANFGSNSVSILLNDANWPGAGGFGSGVTSSTQRGQKHLSVALAEADSPLSHAAPISGAQAGFTGQLATDTLFTVHQKGSHDLNLEGRDVFTQDLALMPPLLNLGRDAVAGSLTTMPPSSPLTSPESGSAKVVDADSSSASLRSQWGAMGYGGSAQVESHSAAFHGATPASTLDQSTASLAARDAAFADLAAV